MKVLIVAETDKILTEYSSFFNNHKYDVLKYRWLMKALDNLEEIEPDICVISASDYPRHWKTFVQFLHATVTSKQTQTILITPDTFPDEEKEKAKALGINSIILQNESPEICNLLDEYKQKTKSEAIPEVVAETENVNEPETIDCAPAETITETDTVNEPETIECAPAETITETDTVNEPEAIECTPAESEKSQNTNSEISTLHPEDYGTEYKDTKFIFTMPLSYQIINGTVIKFDYPMIYFLPADLELKNKLKTGQLIESCTLKTGSFTESLRGQIRNISDTLEICLLK